MTRIKDFDPTAGEFISSGFLQYCRPGPVTKRHYLPAAIVTAMMVGAAVGAVTAAVTGGNIFKGALFGAIGGGISSAIAGAFGGAAGGSAGAAGGLEGAAGGVGGGEAGAAASIGGVAEGAAAVPFESGFVGTEAISGAAGTGTAVAPAATVGTGMQAAAPGGPNFATGFTDGGTASGMAAPEAGTGLGGVSGSTGVGDVVSSAGGTSQGSFLDQLLNKGKGMLNSRFATDTAGQMLKGYAGGRQQEALLEARRQETLDARANARFGNVGSRYAPGMINAPNVYK